MTIEEVNQLGRSGFVERIGWVCEDSPWVAERAWASAPFASIDELHEALQREIEMASFGEKLALLRAHPDLGTRAKISAASTSEQSGAGLDELTREEFDEITRLNAAYREKFGFPFRFAVKGSNKHQIISSLRERISRNEEPEFAEALRQTTRILRFRLETILEATENTQVR